MILDLSIVNKGIIGGGIGVFVVIAVIVLFTNTDEVISESVNDTVSKIKIDKSQILKLNSNYLINDSCELFLYMNNQKKFRDGMVEEYLKRIEFKELDDEFMMKHQQLIDKYGASDCSRSGGTQCVDESRELSDEKDKRKWELMMHPDFKKEYLRMAPTSGGYVQLIEDAISDSECKSIVPLLESQLQYVVP